MTVQKQKGFTLVELAIVMTIIGLLIGGILKGQELMLNARVTATIAQIRSYEAAATTFRDSYAALPGDMLNAQSRLPGCTAACNPDTGAGNGGNSIIGSPVWASTGGWGSQFVALTGAGVGKETVLFWLHLLQADLISGVSQEGLTATVPQWGITHPQARINGGFLVGYGDGLAGQPGRAVADLAGTRPTGMLMAINTQPSAGLTATAGIQAMTPARAAQIDRKMDDGRPLTGFVQGYGLATSCNDNVGTPAVANSYVESVNSNDCSVIFRVQG